MGTRTANGHFGFGLTYTRKASYQHDPLMTAAKVREKIASERRKLTLNVKRGEVKKAEERQRRILRLEIQLQKKGY